MNKQKIIKFFFRILIFFIRIIYPKTKVVGMENLPDDACIIVGNHSQIHGPVACELYFPDNFYTWCVSNMMEFKEVPSYAYKDFWSQKPKAIRPLYKLISYMLPPIAVVLLNGARTIAVYHDNRALSTFRTSVEKLQSGNNIVIFPEHDEKHNHVVYDFQKGFVDVARLYYKRTGKALSFVPLYVAPMLKTMYLGKPIEFSADASIEDERCRICDYLMGEITDIACSLPEHTIVPYRNIPKRLYPKNIQRKSEK